jgi:hypothetical protein
MKITDFMPRCGFIETLLSDIDMIGAEIGVDIGSHAESMLINCDIAQLNLIDPWEDDYCFGYCRGRLETKGYCHKANFMRMKSLDAVDLFQDESLDFIYFDQKQDYETVAADIVAWWPKLANYGVAAWRGYPDYPGMKEAIDEFLYIWNYKSQIDEWTREIAIWKA